MSDTLSIVLAPFNATMGDVRGNAERLLRARTEGADAGADLVVCPEMCLVGYPPDDLVLKPALQQMAALAIEELAAATADGGPALLFGGPWVENGKVYNAAILLGGGRVLGWRGKHELPNYGVFDDKRVFAVGPVPGPMPLPLADGRTVRLGAMVCEDMWFPDVAEALAESGAELLITINASPFEGAKQDLRLNNAVARVTETGLPLIYVNMLGGQDELVFDATSFVVNPDRTLAAQTPAFSEVFWPTRWARDGEGAWRCVAGETVPPPSELEAIYRALVLGLRDYVDKNRFPGVVLGLSGGIDSALSAAIAVDALGPDRVHGVMLPSRYTSDNSSSDAMMTAQLLGIRLDEIAVEPAVRAFEAMLEPPFAGRPPDITEENLQSRVRGVTLMALSNKLGAMVLTTGNKSEMSVGYATLYGDMAGGFNVLKDVYKTEVFALARWRNANALAGGFGPDGPAVPEGSITKAPSAELRPDQKDEDSLPPYEVLDPILEGLIEADRSPDDLVARGFDRATVVRVANLLDLAEYKRRQAAPGVKITLKAFGRDRRYPITNAFRKQLAG